MSDDTWRDRYILTSSLTNPGERAAVYRGAARGEFTRVVRGVYVSTAAWKELSFEGRHRSRMQATHLVYPGTVFSHLSAALLWGLPVVGGDLALPHALAPRSSGGRSITGLKRHALGIPSDVRHVDGLRVTSPATTLLHVASAYGPEVSVPVLDAALASDGLQIDRGRLAADAAAVPASQGTVRAAWAIDFADPASGSAGESVSRVCIHRLGFPRPELQVRFVDAFGLIGVVDFWWPDAGVIGEFDGVGKYLREEFTAGADPATVILAEKERENRLRALGPRVARWDWAIARHPAALRIRLSEAGLRYR